MQPNPLDLEALLRRQPDDLAAEVMEYLVWRGIILDHETRHIVRRTVELSDDLRTVSALSRSLYLSRRALGRRFLDRGIPVPSHWLHFGRILRACVLLQSQKSSLFDVACDLGYPDGFALSNQMSRLMGVRPSVAKEYLGWEWLVESWLRREASTGGFTGEYASVLSLDSESHPLSSQESRQLRKTASRTRKGSEPPTLRLQEG
jgi:AraC-like DNA-binding protein